MASIVEGLFGATPLEIRQHQEAVQQQQAQRYGAQDQMAAIRAAQYGMGSNFGNAIQSMAGVVSPEEAQARQAQQIQSQIDTSTPEGLMRGAQMFNQAGNPQMAQRLVQAARQLQAEQANNALVTARTHKEQVMADDVLKHRHEEALARIAQTGEANKQRSEEVMARIAQAAEAAKMRSEDTRLSNEQRVASDAQYRAMMLQIAKMKQASDNAPEQPKPMTPAQAFKEKQAEGKSSSGVRNMETELDSAIKAANILKTHKGLEGASGISGMVYSRPGGESAKAEALLSEFKSQVKRTGLNLVRQGGGIGSMTEREWPIVEGMVANIDPVKLGAEGTREQINKVISKMQGVLENAKAAHSEMYGGSNAPTAPKRIKFDAQGNPI